MGFAQPDVCMKPQADSMRNSWNILILSLITLAPDLGAAEQKDAGLSIELNSVETIETNCRISFLAENTHSADIGQVVFETVLLDNDQHVDRLMLFDFADLPKGRPRVRQFVLPDLNCAHLGAVLINGAETCLGSDETVLPNQMCTGGLSLTSRTDVELLG